MYKRRYNKCCCQKNYDANIIETACSNCGTQPAFYSPSQMQELKDEACECGFDEGEAVFPANPMYGQSYVPIQYMDKTFTPCVGLKMGTIFPELVSPYSPCQSIEENAFIKAMNKIGEGCNNDECGR